MLDKDLLDPFVLGAIGIASAGLAMLINAVYKIVQRVKNGAAILFGLGGGAGASLFSEEVRNNLLSLLGLG